MWIVLFGNDQGRNEASLKRLRDRGYLPADARIVLAKDSHGGLHGDGTTFIMYECLPECLKVVRAKINEDHDYRLSVNSQEDWQGSRHDNAVTCTREMTADNENDHSSVLPDIGSKDLEFRCIGRIKKSFSYCRTLSMIDHAGGCF